VVATYKISADVQSDGSAIGTGGSRLTADRFDDSVDPRGRPHRLGPEAEGQGPRPSPARPAT